MPTRPGRSVLQQVIQTHLPALMEAGACSSALPTGNPVASMLQNCLKGYVHLPSNGMQVNPYLQHLVRQANQSPNIGERVLGEGALHTALGKGSGARNDWSARAAPHTQRDVCTASLPPETVPDITLSSPARSQLMGWHCQHSVGRPCKTTFPSFQDLARSTEG